MSVKFENVGHIYSPDSPFEYVALCDVNLELPLNKMVAIVGNTGSGKSNSLNTIYSKLFWKNIFLGTYNHPRRR